MARKYVCDNCGTIFDFPPQLIQVWLECPSPDAEGEYEYEGDLGEFCRDCLATLKKIVKEGFSKGRA